MTTPDIDRLTPPSDGISLSTPRAAPPELAPVSPPERIHTLDVLRGIALLGVVIANVWLWFSGLFFRFPAYREQILTFSPDSVAFHGIAIFVSGKAISTFSFLFGLGFAVQMLRAEARGRSVVGVYARRLGVLLVIGLLHMTFLWYGDILTAYALLGFLLLLFRKRRTTTLLVWAGALLLGVPLLLAGIPWLMGLAGAAPPPPDLAEMAERNAATLATLQSGVYADVIRENLRQGAQFYLARKALWLLFIFGLFLIGLAVGRRRIFEDIPRHRTAFRRIAIWGIPIGLAANIALTVVSLRVEPDQMMARPGLMLVTGLLNMLATVPLAAGYVAAVTLLLERDRWQQRLSAFAPVGRMALTNYLMQTVVCLLIFYPIGGGLIGRTGPALGLVIAVALFGVQMVVSRLWLSQFRFGPMEWLWRTLTYGRMQPMRQPRAIARAEPIASG